MVEYMKRHASGFVCPQCAKYIRLDHGRIVDGCRHYKKAPKTRPENTSTKQKGGGNAI